MNKRKFIVPSFIKFILRRAKAKIGNIFFHTSQEYWESRYASGGNSGEGSYGELSEYKAEILNNFVKENKINSVIEFGCGDGNQLSLVKYPHYIGLDVSETALSLCKERFSVDNTKQFYLYEPDNFLGNEFFADLGLSLDVLYHLIEDSIFEKHMEHLFSSSRRFVIIYSTDFDTKKMGHVKMRKFTDKIKLYAPGWNLVKIIKNRYPEKSLADFHIFKKA